MRYVDVYPEARAAMMRRKLRLPDLAEVCGVSTATVRKVLVGEYAGWKHRAAIEKKLGVKLWKKRG